ncbi:MAG: DUF2232 domain-containing protein [Erysipelotrichaceae bacterium]|nr:DUF2232 domain-containing protein [Erysipelotrichaceae bacterium]
MKNSTNKIIKAITEGGIFAGIYALLAIISRYLLTGTDSMLYYFTPLPMAIYVVRNKTTYSIAVLAASIALSFLFSNPLVALMVIMPNIIVGFILGLLEKVSKVKILNYLLIFILCYAVSLISIAAFEIINGIDYWEDVVKLLNSITAYFNYSNEALMKSIVDIATTVTLLVDSIIKTVMLYLVLSIVIVRLKLISKYSLKIKLPLKFNFKIALGYICTFIIFLIISWLYVSYQTILFEILMSILLTIIFIYSLYLSYQTIFYIQFRFNNIKKGVFILIIILCIILLPISTIIGMILNFMNYNVLLDVIK